MAKQGLSYYQAETDRFQDIKVKRLKKKFGCEGYAVFNYIENEIYRVEGCFLKITDDIIFDISEYWCIDEERVEEIIQFCAEVELFDLATYRTRRIVTSAALQQRYIEICRRCKKRMFIPEEISLIIDEAAPTTKAEPMPLFAITEEQPETRLGQPQYDQPKAVSMEKTEQLNQQTELQAKPNSAEFRRTPQSSAENPHKEKKNKENPPSIPPMGISEEAQSLLLRLQEPIRPKPQNPAEPKRNTPGLLYNLEQLKIDARQCEKICELCNYGEIGHPIWQLFADIRRSKGRITMPGHFILSRLQSEETKNRKTS